VNLRSERKCRGPIVVIFLGSLPTASSTECRGRLVIAPVLGLEVLGSNVGVKGSYYA